MPNWGRILKKAGVGAASGAIGVDFGGTKLPKELPPELADQLEDLIADAMTIALLRVQSGVPNEGTSPPTDI